jgi:hypothetical protein
MSTLSLFEIYIKAKVIDNLKIVSAEVLSLVFNIRAILDFRL